jgi:hypothetical protein
LHLKQLNYCHQFSDSIIFTFNASNLVSLAVFTTLTWQRKAVNQTLQQQVHWKDGSLRQATYVAAAQDALTATATMVALSVASGTRSALSLVSLEDMTSLLALSLPLPPRKTHRISHQHQIDRPNAQKGKEVYAQSLMHATIRVAAAWEKKNHAPRQSILKQVERGFAARGHPVSLNTKTVNCYMRNYMVGCAPLLRGYEGIIPKAAFNLLVLTVESFIQIKQLNSKVIMRKQLLIVLNEPRGIKLDIHMKERRQQDRSTSTLQWPLKRGA